MLTQEVTSAVFVFAGSVAHLEATELHVLVMSTNENMCVRYSFKERLSMRSPLREQVGGSVTSCSKRIVII